jgi:hypothetical protein
MRLARDGMPVDLPITPAERRSLHRRVLEHDPGPPRPPFVLLAMVPAATMLLFMAIWLPAAWFLNSPWKWTIVAVCLVLQYPVSTRIVRHLTWPYTRRAMIGCGFEVCRRCGFLCNGVELLACPECGTPRNITPPDQHQR